MPERYMVLWVLGATLLLVVIGVFVIPGPDPQGPARLPWQIEQVEGTTRVFGLTLGRSTLSEAERLVGEPATVSLFRAPEGTVDIEGYFDQVTLSGLKAKIVLTMAVSPALQEQMYNRGIRQATLGSGARKVTLAPQDLERVREAPIATLTYLPATRLDRELVQGRFGEPARRIAETEGGEVATEHWLYPELGLDVAISPEGREVLQYVPPAEFDRLAEPLYRLEGEGG